MVPTSLKMIFLYYTWYIGNVLYAYYLDQYYVESTYLYKAKLPDAKCSRQNQQHKKSTELIIMFTFLMFFKSFVVLPWIQCNRIKNKVDFIKISVGKYQSKHVELTRMPSII